MKTTLLKSIFAMAAAAVSVAVPLPSSAQTVVKYTSPIADYEAFADEKVASWRAANDKVGQIGGWRAYAKEAQQPEKTPALAPTSAKTDPSAGHKP